MSREQVRLVVSIVTVLVVVVGGIGSFLAWSIAHRTEAAPAEPTLSATESPSLATSRASSTAQTSSSPTPSPTISAPASATSAQPQIDGYSEEAVATQSQQQLATIAAAAAAQWSQSESAAQREQRLQSSMSVEAASATAGWDKLYGSVAGAEVSVEHAGEPATTSNDGKTIGVGVMVQYKVRIPHNDGTEVVSLGTALWVVEMPVTATRSDQVTAVIWPNL